MFWAGDWWISESKFGHSFAAYRQLGQFGDIPLARKVNGKWHLAVWRPSNGTFYTQDYNNANVESSYQYGVAGDIPRFADTNGDGTDEYIVIRAYDRWFNASNNPNYVPDHLQIGTEGMAIVR